MDPRDPLRHRRVLDLHADEAEAEADDPARVVDGLKIVPGRLAIADDAALRLRRYAEAYQVEYEVCHAHVHGVPIQHKLAIVWPRRRPLNERVANVGNANPDTTDEVQEQIDAVLRLLYFLVQFCIYYNLVRLHLDNLLIS